ncbi:MAG: bifunctional D-glycero-beta-D-manno-heptose-7-phosphate kinase/D-glycero-beta-D-manno-heptose 1-phosphate adenylyltransferase HldE [Methylococcales bacterium]|nr:bifunctional D-glycero-beta-D-manno-heptose-7-phosphate kinase/D-glycero-beta-D-manno-heptose 1-phosphate adenylyltransferase HldE [Methylococcales bacterium]
MVSVLPDFSAARILVIGDVMLDRYWSGQASRISPEAPVPVVKVKDIEDRVGGAANVALNIAKLGANVTLLGVIGDDSNGEQLQRLLRTEGVNCDFLEEKNLHTICKLRVMAQHQQLIRIDFEETPLNFNHANLATRLQNHLANNDVVVFSDYGKGTLEHVADCILQAKSAGLKTLVDPKGTDYSRYKNADLITPNLGELKAVVGEGEINTLIEKGRDLLATQNIENLLLTRGEAGMSLIDAKSTHSLPAQAKEVFDVTGAGDTVIAVMSLGLAIDLPLQDAMYLANLAAGIVVGKVGTSTVSILELNREMHPHRNTFGVVCEDELLEIMQRAKAHGEKIVMTNGCFDLLHIGHITYLQQAKALGDRLIVAVNSNESVKILKGDSRPINDLQARMAVLAALECVDWVVSFNEETPERLYNRLLPDVLVKGGDYKIADVVGGEAVIANGGEVKILSFVEGHSTSSMIEKARNI